MGINYLTTWLLIIFLKEYIPMLFSLSVKITQKTALLSDFIYLQKKQNNIW